MDVRDKRCGKNGTYLLNDNFLSQENQTVKPPLPTEAPPPLTKAREKELVLVVRERAAEEEEEEERA